MYFFEVWGRTRSGSVSRGRFPEIWSRARIGRKTIRNLLGGKYDWMLRGLSGAIAEVAGGAFDGCEGRELCGYGFFPGCGHKRPSGGRSLEEPVLAGGVGMLGAQWWCSRLRWFGVVACPNVLENRGDEVGVLDAGDDAQRTAALGAGLDVKGEIAEVRRSTAPAGRGRQSIRARKIGPRQSPCPAEADHSERQTQAI